MKNTSDYEALKQAIPYLRSIVALAIWLRHGRGTMNIESSYEYAEKFLDRLLKDVK